MCVPLCGWRKKGEDRENKTIKKENWGKKDLRMSVSRSRREGVSE